MITREQFTDTMIPRISVLRLISVDEVSHVLRCLAELWDFVPQRMLESMAQLDSRIERPILDEWLAATSVAAVQCIDWKWIPHSTRAAVVRSVLDVVREYAVSGSFLTFSGPPSPPASQQKNCGSQDATVSGAVAGNL